MTNLLPLNLLPLNSGETLQLEAVEAVTAARRPPPPLLAEAGGSPGAQIIRETPCAALAAQDQRAPTDVAGIR
jgi:hypothetical protein